MDTTLARSVAQELHNRGVGVFWTDTPASRTIFIEDFPQDIVEGVLITEVNGPPPHSYVDTEYSIIDFWVRGPHADRNRQKADLIYNTFHRRANWNTGNWQIYFSRALDRPVPAGLDLETGKLLRLSVQFICRNTYGVS